MKSLSLTSLVGIFLLLAGIIPIVLADESTVNATVTVIAPTPPPLIGPIGPGNSGPSVFMAWRGIDIGADQDGSGSSINPTDIRNSNYAFTGEKIYYYVLVRDDNGVADINQVVWSNGSSSQEGPCFEVPVVPDNNPYFCAGIVNEDTKQTTCPPGQDTVFINQATNLLYDDQTDKVYGCVLTVESSWNTTSQIKVSAKDQSDAWGSTLPETWNFNPPLTVSLTTSDGQPLTFGSVMKDQAVPGATSPNCVMGITEDLTSRNCTKYDLDQPGQKLCDVSFSNNKLIFRNVGVADLWPYIAATNFESNGMSKCPFSNELSANQFEYRVLQGSWDSGWNVMPQYSPDLGCSGITLNGQCRGGCRITTGAPIDILSPTQSSEVQLKIVWPTPCTGNFNTGSIYAIFKAV
jgi:hypothetical protein